MKRFLSLWMTLCALALLPCARAETGEPLLTLDVSPHQVVVECLLPEQRNVYIRYDTRFDAGEIVLSSETGAFSATLALPGTYAEEALGVSVCALSGEVLTSARVRTAPCEDLPLPDASLDGETTGVSKVRDMVLSAEAGGLRYAFTAPGRDRVYLKCKSGMETHTLTLASGADWRYEGFVPLPYCYPDDKITVTVTTYASSQTLYSGAVYAYAVFPEAPERASEGALAGVTVCIDPGHQRQTQYETVQRAPNMDTRVSTKGGMAQGVVTGRRESIVVLEIALQLRDALLAQGAEVIMTRETQETFVGMIERAEIANSAGADFALRLHCNSRDNKNVQGIQVYCPYQSSYAAEVAQMDAYRDMGFTLLAAMQEATGCAKGDCTLTNAYVGNNWSQMPSFLVEMGYMSNPEEDLLLSSPAYQEKLVRGMTEGILRLSRLRGLVP